MIKVTHHFNKDEHIYMKKGNQIIGTLRYASISNHKGMEQSRRDDLESLAYVLIYFLAGSLPWQSIKAESVKTKMEMIKNKKISISP
jgi:serine/threonine protein kinase